MMLFDPVYDRGKVFSLSITKLANGKINRNRYLRSTAAVFLSTAHFFSSRTRPLFVRCLTAYDIRTRVVS